MWKENEPLEHNLRSIFHLDSTSAALRDRGRRRPRGIHFPKMGMRKWCLVSRVELRERVEVSGGEVGLVGYM